MTAENKTKATNDSVMDFVNKLDNKRVVSDCLEIIEMMSKASGHEAKMWGPAIIGFDTFHYKYDSGREGDICVIGFSPRKGKLTLYLDTNTPGYAETLMHLGKHTTSKVCLYIKHLDDIDRTVLSELIKKSYDYTKSLEQ